MLFVVGLHGGFESCESAVDLLVNGNIDFGRSSPENYYAVNARVLLEVADILAQLLYHVPAVFAVLDVGSVETLCIVLVESGGHGHDLLELFLDGVDVFLAENFGVDGRFVGVDGINVPGGEDNVVKVGQRNDLVIFQIFFIGAATNTDLVVLSHRADRFCQAFAGHQRAHHKR